MKNIKSLAIATMRRKIEQQGRLGARLKIWSLWSGFQHHLARPTQWPPDPPPMCQFQSESRRVNLKADGGGTVGAGDGGWELGGGDGVGSRVSKLPCLYFSHSFRRLHEDHFLQGIAHQTHSYKTTEALA